MRDSKRASHISYPATRIPYLVSRSVRPGIVSGETAESLEDHVDSESSDVGVMGGDSSPTALPHMAVKSYLTAMPDERRMDR
jgi:hypothetical protein